MSREWTAQQRAAIESTDGTILVSAAAGSSDGIPRDMSCSTVSAVDCENRHRRELIAIAAWGAWKADGSSHVDRLDTSSHFPGRSPMGGLMKSVASRCQADLR